MGTRNITAVIADGKYVVTQYGQWDGQAYGQGQTVLDFCRETFRDASREARFLDRLKRCRFATEEEVGALMCECGIDTSQPTAPYSLMDAFGQRYPTLDRDLAAKVLRYIYESETEEIALKDQLSFVGDSLFCEYAYVIDLDKRTLEAYRGFNREPLTEADRFFFVPKNDGEYHQVKMCGSWSLDALPDDEEFYETVDPCDEDEEA